MQVFRYIQQGCDYQLQEGTAAMPDLAPTEVLIEVEAFGLNRADVLQGQGKYPPPPGHSEIPGLEVAGRVVGAGSQAAQHLMNRRVCCIVSGGGYARFSKVDYRHLIPVPDYMPVEHAAGLAEVFLTAYQCLFDLHKVQRGQRVLIHAGASGVGLAAIQLAKMSGAEVLVTSSSAHKLQACADNGADIMINYHQESFAELLKQRKLMVDCIIDVVGGDYLNDNLSVLNLDGSLIQLAMLGGRYAQNVDLALLLSKRTTIKGSTLRNREDLYKAQLVADFMAEFGAALNQGKLNPNLHAVLSPEQVNQGHQWLAANKTVGKLVVKW